jgi:crotonobetainyl-CoA:carnitine CoA-transferase CaiB-like acyl-CoA transferase
MSGMLSGLRVADLSIVTAGAGATQVLADFGADVVKIEGVDRPDLYRGGIQGFGRGEADLAFPPFRTANRNKRGLAVDLKQPEGLEVVQHLVATSDVVVENFRRGVVERLGLGFRDLVALKSDVVLVSISSQGATGPDSKFSSFGTTLDALGGVMSITGYDESTPTWSSGRINYPDQTANSFAPALILAGVLASRRDGRPRWVDFSQRELVTTLLGHEILRASLTGVDPVPRANNGDGLHEWLTRCSGKDHWVAISVRAEEELVTISTVAGGEIPEDVIDSAGRAASVRSMVEAWSSNRTREEVSDALQRAGVAAVPVNSGEELLDDPYLREHNWWQPVHNINGTVEQERGWVVQFEEGGPARVERRAPQVGEHTFEVLRELGYDDNKIESLCSRGVVSAPPAATKE